ncbi:MAG: hydrogenase maturation peptidase HycI [Candidatus Omnitrophica bacterium]|nr:hydrogenase maturation peptidase HycI [Candidatus Omnitrophota bacterium]
MNLGLKIALSSRLKKAKKIALLGVGSVLRGDDAAGIIVARGLDRFIQKNPKEKRIKVFIGDTAPENITGEIKKFKPTHIIIVDSADIGKPAGAIELIEADKIGGVSFSTHQLPLSILADYLIQSLDCQVMVLGIQPKELKFNSKVSLVVKKSADFCVAKIKEILKEEF